MATAPQAQPVTWLRAFVKRRIHAALGNSYLQSRAYQHDLAVQAAALLARGRNAIIDLPTGAGKTQVAGMTTLLVHQNTKRHVLYITPNRILLEQVRQALAWLHPEVRVGILNEETAYNAFAWRALWSTTDLLISTPKLIASRLERSGTNPDTIGAIIIDEFDEFLLVEAKGAGFIPRCDRVLDDLLTLLPDTPLLLMSGTVPQTIGAQVYSTTASILAGYVKGRFHPCLLTVPAHRIKRYLPEATVLLRPCDDPYVQHCDTALATALMERVTQYYARGVPELDLQFFLDRLDGIISGNVSHVRQANGKMTHLTPLIRELAWRVRVIRDRYQFLFEDLFAHITTEVREVLQRDEQGNPIGVKQVLKLIDERPTNEYHAALRGKATDVARIVLAHDGQRGLLFTRFVRLSDALAAHLTALGITTTVVDGRDTDKARLQKLRDAKEQAGVIIITRSTGRRGLDVPFADYAILYSPKSDEYVVWQELSRIRATVTAQKPCYLLYYAATSETARTQRLASDMTNSAHRYRFTLDDATNA